MSRRLQDLVGGSSNESAFHLNCHCISDYFSLDKIIVEMESLFNSIDQDLRDSVILKAGVSQFIVYS